MLNRANFLPQQSRKVNIKLFFFSTFVFSLLAQTGLKASAQVIPDSNLPNNSLVTPNGNILNITEGTTAGNNLFHSFEQFSVLNGQTVFFQNDVGIENIINRVTGSSVSNIDGLIRSLGDANLFLINPNGIIFGANASLDIGGSFIGSTADSLRFSDGSEFSAINPQNTLLTVSIPVGLQYGSGGGDISVQGGGNNLLLNQDFSLDRSGRPVGLQVPEAETLALIGQNVNLEGGNITAVSGNIELWAIENGLVSLVDSNGQLQVGSGQESLNYGDISLTQAASVDASGNNAGVIQLQGKNINVRDGSVIVTDTLGDGLGGRLEIKGTESVNLVGISPISPIFSAILADVGSGATGSGGNITIETNNLEVAGGGQVSSGTFGEGDAGTLVVKAQNINIIGGSMFGPSGLFTPVAPGATGNGGDLTVETSVLEITEAGTITSQTFGFGNSGNLTIKADEIYVSGGNEFAPSSITAIVFKIPGIPEELVPILGAGFGNGGNLTIETGTLQVTDGGQIAVTTFGMGKAGTLEITANNVELSGFNDQGRSGLFGAAIVDSGDGGNINLNSDRVTVKDGASISVGNFSSSNPNIPPGQGKAGNITINANVIELDSNDVEQASSITASTNAGGGGNILLQAQDSINITNGSQITAETLGTGSGGTIEVETKNFNVNSGALVSSRTVAEGDAGAISLTSQSLDITNKGEITTSSTGTGQAGNINLDSPSISTNQGLITATSEQTGGGDINITTDFIRLQNNSLVSTSVLDSNGGGGNININSNTLLAANNSDIRANALLGPGGNINLTTEVIFTSPSSDIDASSQFGLDGVVEINNPDTEKQFGLTELPDSIRDSTRLITASCNLNQDNAIAVVGKGGIPDNPTQSLRGNSVWQDLRLVNVSQQVGKNDENQSPNIAEAKSWIINEKGNVELLTAATQIPHLSLWGNFLKCNEL